MSGLAVKRKSIPPRARTPGKGEIARRNFTRMLGPIRKQVTKMTKGQIRRNVREAFATWVPSPERSCAMGKMLGRAPTLPFERKRKARSQ